MIINIRSIIPITYGKYNINYIDYNPNNKYYLTFISNHCEGTSIRYVEIKNLNYEENVVANIIDVATEKKFPVKINFYKVTPDKIILLYSNLILNNEQKWVLCGTNRSIDINNNRDLFVQFISEPFMVNMEYDYDNKLIIIIEPDLGEHRMLYDVIIPKNKLDTPVYYPILKVFFNGYINYKYNDKYNINNVDYNILVAPVAGIYKMNNISHNLSFYNYTKRVNMYDYLQVNDYDSGLYFLITPKNNYVTMPMSGYLHKIILYNNAVVLKIKNDFYMSSKDLSRFSFNYMVDISIKINRENPKYLETQKQYTLEFCLLIFGNIKFKNKKLQDFYSTLKPNSSYDIKPVNIDKGEELLTLHNCSTMVLCTNRKLFDMHFKNINVFYESNETISELD